MGGGGGGAGGVGKVVLSLCIEIMKLDFGKKDNISIELWNPFGIEDNRDILLTEFKILK